MNKILPGDIVYHVQGLPRIMMRQPLNTLGAYYAMGTLDGETLNNGITDIAFSPDLTRMALALSSSPFIRRFNLADNTAFPNPGSLPAGIPTGIRYHPDGSVIYISHATTPFITRYNTADMTKLADFAVSPGSNANGVAVSPDGTKLAVVTASTPFIHLYDLTTGTKLANPAVIPAGTGQSCDFSPDGTKLFVAVGSTNNQLVYNVADWSSITITTPSLAGTTKDCRFSPDGSLLAIVSSSSPYLRVYNVADWTIRTLSGIDTTALAKCRWMDNSKLIYGCDARFRIHDVIANTEFEPGGFGIFGTQTAATSGLAVYPGGASRKFAGTVKDGAAASLARDLVAYDRGSGRIIGKARSSAVDGSFTMPVWSNRSAVIYAVGEGSELTELFDNVTPVTV